MIPTIRISLCSVLLALGFFVASAQAAESSRLWNRDGEEWHPRSRLPDFSFAGYHRGERPLPTVPKGVSVKKFGAKSDGKTDDSKTFHEALARTQKGTIEIPPERYLINDLLEITRRGVVMRGAEGGNSVLVFPTPLNEIKPNWGATTGGRHTLNYSWSGGFVTIRSRLVSRTLTTITSPAKREDQVLATASAAEFQVGHTSATP